MYRVKLLNVLKTLIVTGDFKSAKLYFLHRGIAEETINKYFDAFKKLRDGHRIHEVEKKNIDYWKSFDDLKKFVDDLSKQKSKRTEKKVIRKAPWQFEYVEGATKVGENNNWVVYKVDTYEAAKKLGTLNWCIVREEEHWDDYNKNSQFYFLLSKKKSYKEESRRDDGHILYVDTKHRFALGIDTKNVHRWYDAEDTWIKDLSSDEEVMMSIPTFKIETPVPLLYKLIKKLREEGLAPTIDDFEKATNIRFRSYDKEHEFLIYASYNDFDDFVKIEGSKDLKWVKEVLDILDIDLDISDNEAIDLSENVLDLLQKEDKNLYNKLVKTVFKEDDVLNKFIEVQEEDYGESYGGVDLEWISPQGKFDYLKKQHYFNQRLANFIVEYDFDTTISLKSVFWRIYMHGVESTTQAEIIERIERQFINNDCILLQDNELWGPISVGIHLNDLAEMDLNDSEDLENVITKNIAELGFDNFDYVYPNDKELLDQIKNSGLIEDWLTNHS
jgi:hypothetical protein